MNHQTTMPVVYRWAYEYGVPGRKDDFVPQNEPPPGVTPEPRGSHGHGHAHGGH